LDLSITQVVKVKLIVLHLMFVVLHPILPPSTVLKEKCKYIRQK